MKRIKDQKATRIDAGRAKQADYDDAIRSPRPATWSASMPPYCYTPLCPVPELREPPWQMQLVRLREWYKRVVGGEDSGEGQKAGHETK